MNNGLYGGWGRGSSFAKKPIEIQEVYTSCFVTPPNDASHVSILVVGGGAGGGGGAFNTATGAGGGGGGGGGASNYRYRVPLKAFQSIGVNYFKVIVGAGGTKGTGATTSPAAGGNGTNGGSSYLEFVFTWEGSRSSTWRLESAGGSAGSGGGTAAGGNGGAGGVASSLGSTPGFAGATGTTSFPAGPGIIQSGTRSYPFASSIVMGGGGGGGSGASSRNLVPMEPPQFLGGRSNLAGGSVGYSIDGKHSRDVYERFIQACYAGMIEAPSMEELYFLSIFGGNSGTGGDNAAVSKGGNGGDGWRGTGGGGGSAAGFAGSQGGDGGAGGSGFVAFFWEYLQ